MIRRTIIKAVGRGKQGSGDASTFRPPSPLHSKPVAVHGPWPDGLVYDFGDYYATRVVQLDDEGHISGQWWQILRKPKADPE